jgi:hypothetical protein
VDVPAADARNVSRSRCYSMSDDEAGVGDKDIPLDGEQEAEGDAAVEAAQARLANGAAAGGAAVAAAGTGAVAPAAAAGSST